MRGPDGMLRWFDGTTEIINKTDINPVYMQKSKVIYSVIQYLDTFVRYVYHDEETDKYIEIKFGAYSDKCIVSYTTKEWYDKCSDPVKIKERELKFLKREKEQKDLEQKKKETALKKLTKTMFLTMKNI